MPGGRIRDVFSGILHVEGCRWHLNLLILEDSRWGVSEREASSSMLIYISLDRPNDASDEITNGGVTLTTGSWDG